MVLNCQIPTFSENERPIVFEWAKDLVRCLNNDSPNNLPYSLRGPRLSPYTESAFSENEDLAKFRQNGIITSELIQHLQEFTARSPHHLNKDLNELNSELSRLKSKLIDL